MTPEYRATATYDGTWWAVTFDNLPPGYGGATQGRTWKQAEHNARECLALAMQIGEDSFELDMCPADPESAALIDELRRARVAMAQASLAHSRALRKAAEILAAKYTIRDVGAMIDMPYQYVSRLAPKIRKGNKK